jgi:hypothetical protein
MAPAGPEIATSSPFLSGGRTRLVDGSSKGDWLWVNVDPSLT